MEVYQVTNGMTTCRTFLNKEDALDYIKHRRNRSILNNEEKWFVLKKVGIEDKKIVFKEGVPEYYKVTAIYSRVYEGRGIYDYRDFADIDKIESSATSIEPKVRGKKVIFTVESNKVLAEQEYYDYLRGLAIDTYKKLSES